MLQYMRQGVEDPERRKLYQKLLTDTLEITDQAAYYVAGQLYRTITITSTVPAFPKRYPPSLWRC